jgi:hypothetical protein
MSVTSNGKKVILGILALTLAAVVACGAAAPDRRPWSSPNPSGGSPYIPAGGSRSCCCGASSGGPSTGGAGHRSYGGSRPDSRSGDGQRG